MYLVIPLSKDNLFNCDVTKYRQNMNMNNL